MTAWFADTSFFIALLSPGDDAHAPALLRARELAKHRLVTSVWILVELANACCPPRRRDGFRRMVQFLRDHPAATIIGPQGSDYESGVALYLDRMDKGWSLTACISFVIMSERGITETLTTDRHFEQAGFSALLATK